jgi:hypothetical protein
MCRARPGTRCSEYSTKTLDVTKARYEKKQAEVAEYTEKYAESLEKTENVGARDQIRKEKHERLQKELVQQQEDVAAAEFEYNACPVGQAELKSDIVRAEEDGDLAKKEELEERLKAAQTYRQSQKDALKAVQTAEKEEGPEKAEEVVWNMYEQASEAQTESLIGLQQSAVELEAARAEQEEYERALAEYRKNDRIDTSEEEAEQARKRKLLMTAVLVAGAGVLAFALAHQAATGQKSSLLQTGRSMAMRQAMMGGRKVFGNLLQGDKKQLDARERRGEVEAERRAAKARETVYRKAEQDKIIADRNAAREAERAGELEHRRLLREEEKQAEAARRQAEYEHWQSLKDIKLDPAVQAEIMKNRRRPSQKKYTGQASAEPASAEAQPAAV